MRGSTKSLMGPKVKILTGQMANTLGSGPWAYVFAASAASAAKCFHTEGPLGPGGLGPGPQPLRGSTLLLKLLKQQKHKQMHMKSLPRSATLLLVPLFLSSALQLFLHSSTLPLFCASTLLLMITSKLQSWSAVLQTLINIPERA